MNGVQHSMLAESPAKAWRRALELTAPIPRQPERILPAAVQEVAENSGGKTALISEAESLTYGALAARANQYSRWALHEELAKDEVVCLLMPNRPEYIAAWLGIVNVGGVAALLNTNLMGSQLAHCIDIVDAGHLIVDTSCVERLVAAVPHLKVIPEIWVWGNSERSFRRIDLALGQYDGASLSQAERRPVSIHDRALCIYTSGTTGLPKAANISHARVMHWSYWFCGMIGVQETDRMFTCLPMYHSVGGVVAPGAMLAAGGSLAMAERFSASRFWSDVAAWRCTLIQYIGELCRYLLGTEPSAHDTTHQVRLACGNGLGADIWDRFRDRFKIPRILEFYAATEGGVSLFNVEGERGSIGRVPPYLTHRFSPALMKFDAGKGVPIRSEEGFCIRCASGEVGEAIGKVQNSEADTGSRFEGYTDRKASEDKFLKNVFEPGDVWVKTGDLMRMDSRGYFYFVDRVGDTFRWKGENVATAEVSDAILAFPGVTHVIVYGVAIPSTDGRAGMAALVTEGTLDLQAFRRHLADRLPRYARPLFLRIRRHLQITGTYKYSKIDLAREGYDPSATTDPIYFDAPEASAFVRLDEGLCFRLRAGEVRV